MTEKGEGWGMGSRYPLAPTPLKRLYFNVYVEFSDKISFEENVLRQPTKNLKTTGVGNKQDKGNVLRKLIRVLRD